MQPSNARRARNKKSPRNPASPGQLSPRLSPAALAFDIEPSRTPSPLIDIAPDSEPESEVARDRVGHVHYVERATEALVRGGTPSSVSPSPRPDLERVEDIAIHIQGHTRAPVLAREPSMLEAFSRTVRNYVPSSIPVPSGSPTPPLISRPISFGNFTMGSNQSTSSKQRGMNVTSPSPRARPSSAHFTDEFALESEEEDGRVGAVGLVRYPSLEGGEDVLWARWDTLRGPSPVESKKLLILCYAAGLQIWDCSSLDAVTELLNLKGDEWSFIQHAVTLPAPSSPGEDEFAASRPLLGLAIRTDNDTHFILYSLKSHQIVKRQSFPDLVSFQANDKFILFSTTDPSMLHIASAQSSSILYSVPSAALVSLSHLTSSRNNTNISNINNNNLVSPPSSIEPNDSELERSRPRSTYALSGRLLAFASPPPRPGSPSTDPAFSQPRGGVQASGVLGGISQADIGNAALKVGGSVLSGMKTLGGLAYAAASRATALDDTTKDTSVATSRRTSFANAFFSKSAPAASDRGHERRRSHGASGDQLVNPLEPLVSALPFSTNNTADGYYVTVLDLQPLLPSTTGKSLPPAPPEKIAQFLVSKDQAPAMLTFSVDGTTLAVSLRDGHTVKVFQIRPTPNTFKATAPSSRSGLATQRTAHGDETSVLDLPSTGDAPWHVYNLRRGRTSALVEGMEWASDARWFAMGTAKRTVHVFAVNPYGGQPDEASHIEGRVRNVSVLQPLSVDVSPLVRLRPSKIPTSEQNPAPLAFTFVNHSITSLPPNLLPAPISPSNRMTPSSVSPSSLGRTRPPLSPTPSTHWSENFHDMLVFDPLDGNLLLHRFTIEKRAKDQGITVPTSLPVLGGTSISLPGVGAVGMLSRTPPTSTALDIRALPSSSTPTDRPTEIIGRSLVVATWNLRRTADWEEVKTAVRGGGAPARLPQVQSRTDWVSQAELSTCSRSRRLLPRPIYVSHQFSFFALGEDYHALLRRYQFNTPATKIEVRKEVEASAYTAGEGESFVEGAGITLHRPSASFDEPLASALSSGISLANSSLPVLPMLPNGTPGARTYRNAIPIRNVAANLSEGVNEGLGRLRREIGKGIRSPRLQAVSNAIAGPIPLEFDEDDEQFQSLDAGPDDMNYPSTSRGTSRGETSISTPSTGRDAGGDLSGGESLLLDGGEDVWEKGWGVEEKQVIEEAEDFDDISAVGFMDEDQLSMVPASQVAAASTASNKGKRSKMRDRGARS